MKRISIDQCFLSNMVKGTATMAPLLDALQKARADGRIVCPIHLEESIFESSFLSEDLRQKIFALQNDLSGGFSFHGFSDQVRYGTVRLILPEFIYPALREVTLNVKSGTDFSAMAKSHKQGKEDYASRLAAMPYPPSSYKKGMKGDDLMKHISMERAASMYRLLKAIQKSRSLLTDKDEWEVSVGVAAALLQMNISARDCEVLMQGVLHHKWEGIPHLWAHSRLNAQVELGYLAGRKGTANDVLDISRLGVALNDADIILCDTAMAENIKQAKVLEVFDGVRVFSMQQADEAAAYVSSF